jgi:DNA-binding NarL/FixJ family response regulator
VRVVIGEDEVLLRRGLELILTELGWDVVGVATDGPDVVRKALAHAPDLLITDIRMPPEHRDEGLRAAMELREQRPDIAILVLSQHASRRYARELLAHGASRVGYLLKQRIADTASFGADLQRLVAGGTVLDPEIAAMMVARASHGDAAIEALTDRQREVLELMAQGRNNAGIAARLGVSEKAITRHTSLIYDALGLDGDAHDHRRVLAVVRYLTHAAT